MPIPPPGRELLAGKRVVVTAAAGTGIGSAVAERCLLEGAQVLAPDEVLARVPLGRLGQPEDVADLVAFLLGDGSGFATGTIHHVDGGYANG